MRQASTNSAHRTLSWYEGIVFLNGVLSSGKPAILALGTLSKYVIIFLVADLIENPACKEV